MDKDMRLLLAETALMATGLHRHEEANTIAECLESQGGAEEVLSLIHI